MTSDLRIAIIGGGIIGMTTALNLAQEGHRIVLFESSTLGRAASWAANGALTPYSDHNESSIVRELAQRSTTMYGDYADWLQSLTGVVVDVDPGDVLEVFLDDEQDAGAERYRGLMSVGYPVSWLAKAEVLREEPHLSDAVSGAIRYSGEGRVDTHQLIRASVVALKLLGVEIHCPATVTTVHSAQAGRVRVTSSDGSAEFDKAIIATGYGECLVSGMPPIRLNRIRGEIIEVLAQAGMVSNCLYRRDSFITPRRDGRLLLGTSYDVHRPGMDENVASVSVGNTLKQLLGAVDMIPFIESAELIRVWKSWRPTTPWGAPIVGPYGAENIIVAVGFGGLGITLAPVIAEVISRSIMGDPSAGRILNSLRAPL